jgi:hypothetical protein
MAFKFLVAAALLGLGSGLSLILRVGHPHHGALALALHFAGWSGISPESPALGEIGIWKRREAHA